MQRTLIGIVNEDNTLDYVSVRSFGNPDYILPLLKKYYTSEETVRQLVHFGSIPSLAPAEELSSVESEGQARQAGGLSNFEKKASNGWAEFVYWFDPKRKWWNHKAL